MEIEADMLGKKTDRESSNKKLLTQLEFYFSDENLINDKFMKRLITDDNEKGIEIQTILKFNKIKNLIGSDEKAMKKIKKVIPLSNKIKLNANKTKILRINKFDPNTNLIKNVDDRTIYVENIPNNVTHETLKTLFSREGRVVNVSIPKNKDKTGKGFAFITYEKTEEGEKAIKTLNNVIPNEFLKWGTGHDIKALKIISKSSWLEMKEEFKKIKKELQEDNMDIFANCLFGSNKSNLQKGCLIRLINVPKNKNKNDIKILVSHYIEPAYVDMDNNDCIVRFTQPELADLFLNKFNKEDIQAIKIIESEEDEYLQMIKNKKVKK
jgi:RNA recognition motif-containing protein